jgi:hypothetical protein
VLIIFSISDVNSIAVQRKEDKEERNMRKLFLSSFFIMAILLMLSCLGCAGLFTERYGTIVPDTNAAKAFESFEVSADLNYYITGPDDYPSAFMGLNKKYMLDSVLWKKIHLSPESFRELVLQMQDWAHHNGQIQYGFAIFDDKGNQIGIWYSILLARAPVLMKDDWHVDIYTPNIVDPLKH